MKKLTTEIPKINILGCLFKELLLKLNKLETIEKALKDIKYLFLHT